MRKIKILLLCVTTALWSLSGATEPDVDLTILKGSMNQGSEIKSVKPSNIPGLFEVQINNQIVYLSADGEKVITGEIYDLKNKVSYTEQTRNNLRKTALASVDDADKIIYKAKDEKFKVSVFTDISCPYCTKLHENMEGYNNNGITVEYLAYPRAGAGSKTQKDMQKIWCSKEKAIDLTKAKVMKSIPQASCDGNQTVDQFLLGREIGVDATPTFIFSNGELQAGFVKPESLLKILTAKFPKQ